MMTSDTCVSVPWAPTPPRPPSMLSACGDTGAWPKDSEVTWTSLRSENLAKHWFFQWWEPALLVNEVIMKFERRWDFSLLHNLVVLGTFQVSLNKAVTFSCCLYGWDSSLETQGDTKDFHVHDSCIQPCCHVTRLPAVTLRTHCLHDFHPQS